LADSGGLYLEVSPAGSKRWFWKYRREGKEGRMALGSYPDVGLTTARKARDAAKLHKVESRDPVQVRKLDKLPSASASGDTYNHRIPQRALDHRNPIQALKAWRDKKPELFVKRVYEQTELDSYPLPPTKTATSPKA